MKKPADLMFSLFHPRWNCVILMYNNFKTASRKEDLPFSYLRLRWTSAPRLHFRRHDSGNQWKQNWSLARLLLRDSTVTPLVHFCLKHKWTCEKVFFFNFFKESCSFSYFLGNNTIFKIFRDFELELG